MQVLTLNRVDIEMSILADVENFKIWNRSHDIHSDQEDHYS